MERHTRARDGGNERSSSPSSVLFRDPGNSVNFALLFSDRTSVAPKKASGGADYCCHYPEIKGGENNRMITKAVPSSSIVITQNNVKTGGCSQTDRQKKKTGCSNALPRLLQPYFIDTTMDSSLCLLVSSATGQPELGRGEKLCEGGTSLCISSLYINIYNLQLDGILAKRGYSVTCSSTLLRYVSRRGSRLVLQKLWKEEEKDMLLIPSS